jgi:hypothetical protein
LENQEVNIVSNQNLNLNVNQKTNKVMFPWPDDGRVPSEDDYRNNKKQEDKKK